MSVGHVRGRKQTTCKTDRVPVILSGQGGATKVGEKSGAACPRHPIDSTLLERRGYGIVASILDFRISTASRLE
ncbi:MAG: hypothetical protein AB1576_14130 [Bacillota bacterium]